MNKGIRLLLLFVLVFAVGFAASYFWQSTHRAPSQAELAPPPQPPAPPTAELSPPPSPAPAPTRPRPRARPKARRTPAAKPAPPPSVPATPPPAQPSPPPTPVAAPEPVIIPVGTELLVSLLDPVSSDKSQPGDEFAGTLHEAVLIDGQEVIPKHAKLWGTVVRAVPSGRLKKRAELALRLTAIQIADRKYNLRTSTLEQKEGSKTKRDVIAIGGGAGIGAAIGGAASGGKGAGLGALIGAGAGTAAAALTGKRNIKFPPETLLRFRLEQPLQVQP